MSDNYNARKAPSFAGKQGGFNNNRQGGFSQPHGGFNKPQGGGGFNRPQGGGFNRPQGGGFNRPQGGGFNKFNNFEKKVEEEVAPEKPLSRREQLLHAQLADSMANEKAAMTDKKEEKAGKKFDTKKEAAKKPEAKKSVHPIVAAFGNNANAESSYGKNLIDFCGKGHPFDRLQFGYSPSENEEARAYHSQWTAQQWIKMRSANYKLAIIKRQRLAKPNCEALSTMFKLKRYWSTISASDNANGNIFDGAFADDLLEQLASRQLRADETQ